MLTKSAKRLLSAAFLFPGAEGGYGCGHVIPVVAINEANLYAAIHSDTWPIVNSYELRIQYGLYGNLSGIYVGSGTTQPTDDDYCLENENTGSNISGFATVNSRGVTANNVPYIELLVTITNNGSGTVTIGEIGYFARMKTKTTQSSDPATGTEAYNRVMIDRTVLDNSISLAMGDTATITYTISGATD